MKLTDDNSSLAEIDAKFPSFFKSRLIGHRQILLEDGDEISAYDGKGN